MLADRVLETTATTGTSTYVLGGAPVGRRTFIQGFGTGKTVNYLVEDATGVNWEIGLGVVTAAGPDTLTRATIIRSSNSNNAVSWAAGTKYISAVAHADHIRFGMAGEIPTAAGTAQALTLSYSPSLTKLINGQLFEFKVSTSTNTAINPTLNIDSIGAKTIVDREGGAIYAGHLVASSILLVIYESTGDRFRIVGMAGSWRKRLTANMNFYVDGTLGSDTTGTGLATGSAAWATIQKAINYIQQNIDLGGFIATINVANGTYTTPVSVGYGFTGLGYVLLNGNTTTPSSCFINTTSATCLSLLDGARLKIQGFKFAANTAGNLINLYRASYLHIIGACEFSSVAAGWQAIQVQHQSQLVIEANYTISTGGAWFFDILYGSVLIDVNKTITITGTPNYTTSFIRVADNSSAVLFGNTYSGSATGSRYGAFSNSVIETAGGGASYLPGNAAGSTSTGGQYV